MRTINRVGWGLLVSLAVLTAGGCAESEPIVAEPPLAVEHAALGYLDVRDAVVTPWCSGVLVAPDVVLTAARCVEKLHPEQVRFGVGAATPAGAQGGLYGVSRILLHRDRADWQHNLAALILQTPIANVPPSAMGLDMVDSKPQRLESITYTYVNRGEASVRSLWAGESRPDGGALAVVPTEGQPTCLCVNGAGMVDEAGRLLGLISTGARNVEGAPAAFCASAFNLATVANNRDFVSQALRASGVPVPVVP